MDEWYHHGSRGQSPCAPRATLRVCPCVPAKGPELHLQAHCRRCNRWSSGHPRGVPLRIFVFAWLIVPQKRLHLFLAYYLPPNLCVYAIWLRIVSELSRIIASANSSNAVNCQEISPMA